MEFTGPPAKKSENGGQNLPKCLIEDFDTGFFFRTPHETSTSNQATHVKKDVGVVVNYYQKVGAAEIRLWENLEIW